MVLSVHKLDGQSVENSFRRAQSAINFAEYNFSFNYTVSIAFYQPNRFINY